MKVLREPVGSPRTAGLVAWVQSLFASEEDTVPVLVGGAAVDLYTGGAHTTADIDFSGKVTPRVGRILQRVGFRREGRSWVHDGARVYLDFVDSEKMPGRAAAVELKVGEASIRALAPEELIAERLLDWKDWRSEVDVINALLVFRTQKDSLDRERLERAAEKEGVIGLLRALERFALEGGAQPAAGFLEAMEGTIDE